MLQTFLNPDIIKQAWPIILAGLGNTVLLSIVVVPLGLFGGLVLAMLASVRKPWVRWPLMAWVDFFRAFPPLVLLIFFYAGLPFVGLELGGFACVCIAFFFNTLEVVKLTALGSVVAMPELLFQARQAQSLTYNPTPIVVAALIYFVLLWPLVRLLSRLENRQLARP